MFYDLIRKYGAKTVFASWQDTIARTYYLARLAYNQGDIRKAVVYQNAAAQDYKYYSNEIEKAKS